jgi:MOSC domain-containing protein YiiM
MWATRRTIEPGLAGVVASVNLNRGGVPKPPVDGTVVRTLGLDGDGHNEPDVHGGPTAAVCLYPQEAVERVRADGHQSFPGSYGENLTLLGIDWSGLRDGDRLELGDDGDGDGAGAGPLLELTQFAAPCATQSHWFVEGRIARISHKVRPQDARWYARVLREGPVAPGMAVRVVRDA